jgi:hypothetical protein
MGVVQIVGLNVLLEIAIAQELSDAATPSTRALFQVSTNKVQWC